MIRLSISLLMGLFITMSCLAQQPDTAVQDSSTIQNSLPTAKPAIVSTQLGNQSLLVANHIKLTAPITGDVLIIAGKVDLESEVTGDATIIAGQITLAGHTAGDIVAIGGNVDIRPQAVIDGNVKYLQSSSLSIAPGAVIHGKLEPWVEPKVGKTQIKAVTHTQHHFPMLFYTGLFIVGLILSFGFPKQSLSLLANVRQRPWMSLISGLGVLIIVPILIITSLITVIGLPLSIILFGLYLAGLWLAYAYAGWLIGASLVKVIRPSIDFNQRFLKIVMLIVGLAALYIVGNIPYIGFWFKVLVLLLGLGGIALTFLSSRNAVVNDGFK